jgi:hypothetical protein
MTLLAILMALGPISQFQGQEPEVLGLFRQIVAVAEEYARADAKPEVASGPLMLEVNSFLVAAKVATRQPLDKASVATAIGRAFEDVQDPVRCERSETGERRCWIKDHGVHVRLDSLQRTQDGFVARVTYQYTFKRSYTGSVSTCTRTVQLSFRRDAGDWVLYESKPIRVC